MCRVFALALGLLVALLAEGVDRNTVRNVEGVELGVALLAEGVDRNICPSLRQVLYPGVALLAEGVDRNPSPVAA